MATKRARGQLDQATADQLRDQLVSTNPKTRIETAFSLAKIGILDGVDVLVNALQDSSWSVRSRAAHYLGRIGTPKAVLPLAALATSDVQTVTRNEAIYALEGIGRIACVPHLIDCLGDDDPERREDARTALVRIVGESVLKALAEEIEGKDPEECNRVSSWFHSVSSRFESDKVYSWGLLAHPDVFIARIQASLKFPVDALLMELNDWTGTSFGEKPVKKVLEQWKNWLELHASEYERGERYFYGRLVR